MALERPKHGRTNITFLKVQRHEIFDLCFFNKQENTPRPPGSQAKAVSNIGIFFTRGQHVHIKYTTGTF
jgi:hypothetical protein